MLPSTESRNPYESGKEPGALHFLLLVARLRAPEWARAAGYGWLTLDVLTGILSINGLPYDTTWPVRMGGHVLAGVWIATSSLHNRRLSIRIVGLLTGVILGGYSLVGNVLPLVFIQPSGIGLIAWLALMAVFAGPEDLRAPDDSDAPEKPDSSPACDSSLLAS